MTEAGRAVRVWEEMAEIPTYEAGKPDTLKASHGLDEPASAMVYNDQPPDMIFYQGLALLKLQNTMEAKRRFHKLIDYAEKYGGCKSPARESAAA